MIRRDDRLPVENWVLAALRDPDRERLMAHAERVSLSRDERLQRLGGTTAWMYFPVDAVVSLVQSAAPGELSEIATVGRDGVIGLPGFLGDAVSAWEPVCQIPGEALRVPVATVGTVVTATPGVRDILGRYSQALLAQIGTNAGCNQLHSMLQRCSRWILLVRRQTGNDEFPLTQQALASMLAVRRATVTVAAGELQKAGAITYHHGTMRIANLRALKDGACVCYSMIVDTYDRLFA